jgi:hypothetical protein
VGKVRVWEGIGINWNDEMEVEEDGLICGD